MIDFRTKLQEHIDYWDATQKVMDKFNSHYSVQPYQARRLFDAAMFVPQNGVIVELGVCHGRTTAMFAMTVKKTGAQVFGVDFFGLEGSARLVRDNLHLNKLSTYATIIEANTHEAARYFNLPIDLLFIDAGHDEANVKPDLELWLPKLKPGGWLYMHDCDDPYDPDSAHWAVRKYGEQFTQGWDNCRPQDGMWIAQKPALVGGAERGASL
jgi:predicted O-methyltransferase YrrM